MPANDIPQLVARLNAIACHYAADRNVPKAWTDDNSPEVSWQELYDISDVCAEAIAALQSPPPREAAPPVGEVPCKRCKGDGYVTGYEQADLGGPFYAVAEACPDCRREHVAPRVADAALWPLVEKWAVAHREWMAPHDHAIGGPEFRRYDEARTALLAYRPPSAPSPPETQP